MVYQLFDAISVIGVGEILLIMVAVFVHALSKPNRKDE